MTTFRLLITLTFATSVLPACAGPAIQPAPPMNATIDAPIARVWTAMLTVFTDTNVPITTIDRSSGFIRSGTILLRWSDRLGPFSAGEIADCGHEIGFSHTATGMTYITFTALMTEAAPGQTSVRLRTTMDNVDASVLLGSTQRFRCVSRGVFEGFLSQEVARLAGAPAPKIERVVAPCRRQPIALDASRPRFPGDSVVTVESIPDSVEVIVSMIAVPQPGDTDAQVIARYRGQVGGAGANRITLVRRDGESRVEGYREGHNAATTRQGDDACT